MPRHYKKLEILAPEWAKTETKKRDSASIRITNLLKDLEEKLAKQEGKDVAKMWRRSIGGWCTDARGRLTCIEIDGVRDENHWLITWLNKKL